MTKPGVALIVLAKAPVPGRVKTRLVPPCTVHQAARIAAAALMDTLDAVVRCRATRKVVVLDGPVGEWLPPGVEVVPQRGDGLAARLTAAWLDVGGPALQIGMDTPQVSAQLLDTCLGALGSPGTDAVLGHASDGGWWAIGQLHADPRTFAGVPMSTPHTGRAQADQLSRLGLRTKVLPTLRDVDTIGDALAVAELIPGSRFADRMRVCVPEALGASVLDRNPRR